MRRRRPLTQRVAPAPGCRVDDRRLRYPTRRSDQLPHRLCRGQPPSGLSSASLSRLLHDREAGPKHPGLLIGALGELPATDAPREAKVITNQRAGSSLRANARAVDDQGRKALRGRIDRGRQSTRPGADDDHIEFTLGADPGLDPESLRHLGVRGVGQDPTIANNKYGRRCR
jgi:hypothetical protein